MATIEELQQRAWALTEESRWAEAIPATEEALRLMEVESGAESVDVANLSSELAVLLEKTNRFEEAIVAAGRAVSILKEYEPFEEFARELATILVRSHGVGAMALRAVGRFAEARAEIQGSVSVAERYMGPADELTGAAYCGLGMFYKYSGEFDEAERAYKRSMEILVPICGEESEILATLYHNLGGLEHSRQNYEAGVPWARKAYEVRKKLAGAECSETVADAVALAGLLDEMGPSAESERIYREALVTWERIFGPEHYEIASTLHNLAALRRDMGDRAEAIQLYRQAYEMKRRLLGAQSPDTGLTATCLAQLLGQEPGGRKEALELAQAALSAYERNCEEKHPERVACAELVQGLKGSNASFQG
ncbi:MAG: tetratricopeptide repeat protein [Acidobacteria bacterium]|nr:tetratricopeptide repeat protein [Acidobacteriota bacterium]